MKRLELGKVIPLVMVSVIMILTAKLTEVPKLEDRIQALEHALQTTEQKRIELDTENAKRDQTAQELQKELEAAHKETEQARLSSRGGLLEAPHTLDGFQVTWYNDSGTTASGRHTQEGVTVAADPNVLPLGTMVRLLFPDGTQMTRRVDDTGGAVKGRIIDVYASASTSELLSRGRTHGVKVTIL